MRIQDLTKGGKYAYKKSRYDKAACAEVLSAEPLTSAVGGSGPWSSASCYDYRTKQSCRHVRIDHRCYIPGKGGYVHVRVTLPYTHEPRETAVPSRYLTMPWEDYERKAAVAKAERAAAVKGEIEKLQRRRETWEQLSAKLQFALLQGWIPSDFSLLRIANENAKALDVDELDDDWRRRDVTHRLSKVEMMPDELLQLLVEVTQ